MKIQALQDLVGQACALRHQLGVDGVEAYACRTRQLNLSVRGEDLESLRSGSDEGIGVRVFHGQRIGFAYTCDLSPAGILSAAKSATDQLTHTTPDARNIMPSPEALQFYADDFVDVQFDAASLEEKIEIARLLEGTALSMDPHVESVGMCSYLDTVQETAIANTKGISAYYRMTRAICRLQVVVSNGNEREMGYAYDIARGPYDLAPERVARDAVNRGLRLLGAERSPTARVPVILDPLAGAGLFAHLGKLLTGDAVITRQSPFHDKLGQEIGSSCFTLTDDPLYPNAPGSRPFDAEGLPSRPTAVVTHGKLDHFLHNSYTAKGAAHASTASAYRTSYRALPEVGPSNFVVAKGRESPDSFINEVDRGLLFTFVQGGHAVNPYTGAFSIGGSGIWIERGKYKFPVREVTVSGSFEELLRGMVAVGNDPHIVPDRYTIVTPTILVEGLSVAGK